MAEILVDFSLCDGYSNCVAIAPKIFDVDDNGIVVVKESHVDGSDLELAEKAARSCPAGVLRVVKE